MYCKENPGTDGGIFLLKACQKIVFYEYGEGMHREGQMLGKGKNAQGNNTEERMLLLFLRLKMELRTDRRVRNCLGRPNRACYLNQRVQR